MIVILIITVERAEEKERRDANGQCKEIWINQSLGCALIKRIFEAREEEEGGVAGLLFFATLSSPTGRKYTRRRTVPERTPLEIRRGKVSEKRKQEKRGDEGCVHVAEMRDILVWCTTSGPLLRNKPSSHFLSF